MAPSDSDDDDRKIAHEAAETSASIPSAARVRARRNQQKKAERTVSFHDLPAYLKDNEFIEGSYRRVGPVRQSVRSLFGLHNETGNIYTHLLGFLLFLALTVYVSRLPPTPLAFGTPQIEALWGSVRGRLARLGEDLGGGVEEAIGQIQHELSEGVHSLSEKVHHLQEGLSGGVHSISERVHHLQDEISETARSIQAGLSERVHHLPADVAAALEALSGVLNWPTARWPTYVYMAGAMTCLLLSSLCHLLGCCRMHITKYVWRVDYAGICILIVCSFIPFVYYGFLCHPFWLVFYLVSTTFMGVSAVAVTLLDQFQAREWRNVRAGMFVALGLWGLAPVLHQSLINRDVPQVQRAVMVDLVMGVTYVSGAVIYAKRIPERWFPGKFDLWFHSHQIFHIAVVLGALIHYKAVMLLLEWRDASGGCAVPVTAGHVPGVLQQMRDLGHDLFSIDEVWHKLTDYVHDHFMTSSAH